MKKKLFIVLALVIGLAWYSHAIVINDPDGRSASVSSANRLQVDSVGVTEDHYANHADEQAYNVLFEQSPTAADDCIFYMRNMSTTDLVVEGVTIGLINTTADTSLYIKLGGSGTRNNATALTPANLNAGSGNAADGVFETGVDLDGGSATLTGGSIVEKFVFGGITDLTSTHYNFDQDIIIPDNQILTIWGTSTAGTYYGTIDFYYHD